MQTGQHDMLKAIIGGALWVVTAAAAAAQNVGMPRSGQTGLQPPMTELARDQVAMDNLLLWITGAIVVFVTALLAYVVWRFNAKKNPTPSRFTHNSTIEVIWTAVPVMILVAIAFPSLNLLYKQLTIPEADVTIKATGNQWYWSYEYPDYEIDFDSIMVASDYADWDAVMASDSGRAEIEEFGVTRETWRLAADASMVVPVGAVIRVQATAADVIHAWTVPSFGVKMDAIPGRLNEMWFQADEVGIYYGQCSVLCGVKHAYMPIQVKVVSREDFDAWVEETRLAQGLPPQTAPKSVRLAQAAQ